jgi:NAD(P)H dehydrogenase (quinone)
MKYVVTGASGHFGRGVTQELIERGIAPSDLILLTRSPHHLSEIRERGASVRYGDFDDYDSLASAFAGGEKALIISATKVGYRIPQHRTAIKAAQSAGVRHVIYTSFIGKEPNNPSLAVVDHRGTEQALAESSLSWTVLRNAQYSDALVEAASPIPLRTGRWIGSSGQGRMPFVTRADCISAAAAALVKPGVEQRIFNITGPDCMTFRQMSQVIAEVAGKPIEWVDVDSEAMYAFFDALGVPRVAVPDQTVANIPWSSDDIVSIEAALKGGWFDIQSDDFEFLTGRKPQSFHSFAFERRSLLQDMARHHSMPDSAHLVTG